MDWIFFLNLIMTEKPLIVSFNMLVVFYLSKFEVKNMIELHLGD